MKRIRQGSAGLRLAVLIVLLPLAAGRALEPRGSGPPSTGQTSPDLAGFDGVVKSLLAKWQVPGAAAAVVQDGHLVIARGYGWADREKRQPVRPDSLFRIASLSKSLTAAAILKLVEEGRLGLDDRPFDLLSDLAPRPGGRINPDLHQITIRHLLQHSG